MDIIEEAKAFAKGIFAGDASGHDFDHTMRVFHIASRIAKEEGADILTVQLAALLHDVDDHKLSPETSDGKLRAAEFLHSHGVGQERTAHIIKIIDTISFSANKGAPESIEGKCVQDADRLDAIGAIGIARAFAFGGSRGRKMYDPKRPPQLGMNGASYAANTDGCTVNHFYEKLLLLEGMMTTQTGRKLARHRHEFMESFLKEFFAEWNGEI